MQRVSIDKPPSEPASNFEALISPLSPEEFFTKFWDQKLLHISGPSGRFNEVMSTEDFCKALYEAKLGDTRLKYLQKSLGDRDESQDFFLRQKAAWSNQLNPSDLAQQFRTGTLVFDSIQRTIPSAKTWCRSLYSDLNSRISINAYFSAGLDASAFDAHFDPQDVFILQLEGEKEWQLWERDRAKNCVRGFPERRELTGPERPADETVLMTPGDMLYVPKGMWHWPRSLDDNPSLHMTLTIVMPRATDILKWLGQALKEDEDCRATLPFSKHQPDMPMDAEALRKALDKIHEMTGSENREKLATAFMSFDSMQLVMTDKDDEKRSDTDV